MGLEGRRVLDPGATEMVSGTGDIYPPPPVSLKNLLLEVKFLSDI